MWYWRRIEKVKLPEKGIYGEVLKRIGEKKTLLNNILRRKTNWICHIEEEIGFLMMTLVGK